jgi:hypothetical protein
MPTLEVRRTSGIAALIVLLVTAVLVAPGTGGGALAAAKKGDFSPAVSPGKTQVGDRTSFTVDIANLASSSNSIGSVQVVVPAAFGDVTLGSVTPSRFTASTVPCSSDSPAGCGASGSTLIEVATPANGGAQKILPGQSLSFSLTATARSKGTFTWATAAKNSASWSTGQTLSPPSSDPTVQVLGAPAQLAFTVPPPSEVTAGQKFPTSVAILDADGGPTLSEATVSLHALGLRGTRTAAAADGIARLTGLSLTRAGSVTVTASSPGLTSAIATVVVRPGLPSAIQMVAPSCSSSTPDCTLEPSDPVPAGGSFAAAVSIVDQFGNVVDTPQTVTVVRAASGSVPSSSVTQSASTGSLLVDLVAPVSVGSYHYTVSSGSLPPASFDVTVEAGPAVAVTIDALIPEGNQTLLAKDQPFDVALTTRDSFGNPARYSGTVSLTTTGGTGSSLGTLNAPVVTLDSASSATAEGVTYDGYGNGITLVASAPGLLDGHRSLDVNLFATTKEGSPGQSLTVGLGACQDATPQVPVCTSMILKNGAIGPVTVAQGECDPFTPCRTGAQNEALLFNGLADLTDGATPLYSRQDPAVIVLRCDKTLCGGAGVGSFPLLFQQTGWAADQFAEAPPCPAKGRIGAGQTFCQDYRQNNRDNAGDLIAYLLFLDDAKATFK